MRSRFVISFVLALAAACEAPRVVDCTDDGRFVEAGGDHWCAYPARAGVACPRLLPVMHTLPWGGYACAAREHVPLPSELCAALGRCADGGGP